MGGTAGKLHADVRPSGGIFWGAAGRGPFPLDRPAQKGYHGEKQAKERTA